MQVHQSEFRSIFTCARTVFRKEGISAFYVSYPTTLTMTVPEVRARAMDEFGRTITVISEALAKRAGRPADDLA